MRIVLDLQGCQSPGSRVRGIGRYSMALAQAIARNPDGHEIWIALNGAFPDTVEAIRGAFEEWVPQQRIVVWETVGPVAEADPANRARRALAERLREDFLARLKPDVVHVSTLFEGWADDINASVDDGEGSDYLTAVTLYDLIPLARERSYLADARVKAWYFDKLESLKRAGILLAISDFAAQEAVDLLGLPSDHIFNISAAADSIFQRLPIPADDLWKTCAHYGIERPYVMYTGGMDPRKNLDGLIHAYADLPREPRRRHQLVIAGTASPDEMRSLRGVIVELGLAEDEVIFTGYVPDSDLVVLYNACSLYVFPSFHEGFGLPALEAMACGAVVIGANATSLPEVIGHPRAMFDPADRQSMRDCMLRALTDESLRAELLQHARSQVGKFSWDISAARALRAFERMHADQQQSGRGGAIPTAVQGKQRIAALPLRPHSGVGGDAPALMDMLGDLSALFSVTVLTADREMRQKAGELGIECPSNDAQSPDLTAFDAVICELSSDYECIPAIKAASSARPIFYVHDDHIPVPRKGVEPLTLSEILLAGGGYALMPRHGESTADNSVSIDQWMRSRASGWIKADASSGGVAGGSRKTQSARIIKAISESVVNGLPGLCRNLLNATSFGPLDDRDWHKTAVAVALNRAMPRSRRQLLVDVSYLVERDTRTGVQRVVYKVLDELLRNPPPGYLVEPIYFNSAGVMYYARRFCWRLLGLATACPGDEVVEPLAGDVFLGLDLAPDFVSRNGERFVWLRNRGVRVHFVVYDLLPVLRPECFDPEVARVFEQWARVVAEVADGALCISRSVADELTNWLDASGAVRYRPFRVSYFHLGADLEAANAADRGDQATRSDNDDRAPAQFLMVSTVEPRKGHAQTLDAFELLWSQGSQARLVIVGKAGWLVDQLIERIKTHPELGRKLVWLDHADDAQLIDLYRTSSALLVASEGEGFGLPLIEAAHYGLPVICRDIPVFREVACEHASYFDGYEAQPLAEALAMWMERWAAGTLPDARAMHTSTWSESTRQLLDAMFSTDAYRSWSPTGILRFPAFDRRLQSEVGQLSRGAIRSRGDAGLLVRCSAIHIPRGSYCISISGRLEGDPDGCLFELRATGSDELLISRPLRPGGVLLLEAAWELSHDVRDVEFTVRVARSARVDFRGVEFRPTELNKASP